MSQSGLKTPGDEPDRNIVKGSGRVRALPMKMIVDAIQTIRAEVQSTTSFQITKTGHQEHNSPQFALASPFTGNHTSYRMEHGQGTQECDTEEAGCPD